MPEWEFQISPVAASRPRLSRRGAYLTGPYKQFRKDMIDLAEEVLGDWEPMLGLLHVDIELYIKQPKKTKLDVPRADVDNFIKAILDSLNGYLWEDDRQIKSVYAIKQWAPKNQDGYFTIGVDKC